MKAATYSHPGTPDVFRFAEVADPVPAENEVLIRVEAISIEGGDLINRSHTRQGPDEVLGYAAAGEIVELGKTVTGLRVGQKVASFNWKGSHAELRAVPAAHCFVVPDGLDIALAATIPVGPGTAAYALDLGGLKAGQTVLVLGASGGVGLAAVQIASKAGARVIGTGTRAESLAKLKEHGLSDGIVTTEDQASDQIRSLLGGNHVDLVIDNVGGAALIDALEVLKDGGRVVLVGVFGGRNTMINAGKLLWHRHTVIGCLLGAAMEDPHARTLIDDLFVKARDGNLKVPIDATFALSEAEAAHRRAEERGRIGRVVMTTS
jgi:NADPH:quinone reductase-like Zn-dependent oxidoreductase